MSLLLLYKFVIYAKNLFLMEFSTKGVIMDLNLFTEISNRDYILVAGIFHGLQLLCCHNMWRLLSLIHFHNHIDRLGGVVTVSASGVQSPAESYQRLLK